jgi:hypothetical protein
MKNFVKQLRRVIEDTVRREHPNWEIIEKSKVKSDLLMVQAYKIGILSCVEDKFFCCCFRRLKDGESGFYVDVFWHKDDFNHFAEIPFESPSGKLDLDVPSAYWSVERLHGMLIPKPWIVESSTSFEKAVSGALSAIQDACKICHVKER